MKKLAAAAMIGMAFIAPRVLAAEQYPRSAELVAAQADLDALRAIGPRTQMDAPTQKRLDAAITKRNVELDKRNEEWKKADSRSMFMAQVETCSTARKGHSQGKSKHVYFDELLYVGFSTDETLDIILKIDSHTPEVGKSVRVAFCILGLPDDTVRTETKYSKTVMFVYPKMFVHSEDGIVTAWSDR